MPAALSRYAGLSARMQLGAFGEAATYTPKAGGPALSIRAVLRQATAVIDGEVDIETMQPTARVSRADVAEPRDGDRLEADGQAWVVRDKRDTGTGLWLLMLHRAP
jgi:hypothetical protein